MASATPVVLTDSGGVRDFAQDGYNCRLTPPRQPAALAAAMLEVLTDGALAERIAAGGPPTAQRYDWERVTDHFERTLAALAQ
jgi:glycosyltransferase involved in cell wall biosynthesis